MMGPGLSCLRVHELHLHAGRHAASIASLGLHLILNGADLKQKGTKEAQKDQVVKGVTPPPGCVCRQSTNSSSDTSAFSARVQMVRPAWNDLLLLGIFFFCLLLVFPQARSPVAQAGLQLVVVPPQPLILMQNPSRLAS